VTDNDVIKEEECSYDDESIFIKDEPEVSIEEEEEEEEEDTDQVLEYDEQERKHTSEPIQCEKCFSTFSCRANMNSHKCLNNTYPCNICSKEFTKRKDILEHRKNHLKDKFVDTKYQCDRCPFGTSFQHNLKRHMAKMHEKRDYLGCPECKRKFTNPVNQQNHIKNYHKKHARVVPPCHYCKATFTDDQSLEKHIESHESIRIEDGMLKCIDCERTFETIQYLRMHRSTVHGAKAPQRHICETCGTSFKNPSSLKLHVVEFHPTDDDIKSIECKCSGCDMQFESAMLLELHQRDCLKEPKTYSCKKCSLKWSSVESIRKHYAEVHRTIGEICKICGLCLKSKSIVNHMKLTHMKQQECACAICGKVFTHQATLTRHMLLIHRQGTGGILKCAFCDYIEKSQYKIDQHVNMKHTKANSFDCPHCTYTGFSKQTTKRHIRLVHKIKENQNK
jgi:hypothetical protein